MKIVYDAKLKRPACVLLQVAMGGDQGLANQFPSEYWLTSPTKNMHLYEVTQAQLEQLITMTKNEPIPTNRR